MGAIYRKGLTDKKSASLPLVHIYAWAPPPKMDQLFSQGSQDYNVHTGNPKQETFKITHSLLKRLKTRFLTNECFLSPSV